MRPITLHGHERPLSQIKYNRSGDLIFSAARDKSPSVWYSSNGKRLGTYDGHNGAIYGIDVSSDTQTLATASFDNSVKLWDVERGVETRTFSFTTGARCVEFALGNKEILVLTESRLNAPGHLHVFSLLTDKNEPMQSMYLGNNKATVARWGHLNKTIVSGHEDGTIKCWDAVSGEVLHTIKPHTGVVTDIEMSSDKSYFISSSKDCTAKIIDAQSFKQLKCFNADRPLNSAALSPLYEQIILGGGQDARNVTTTSARAGRFEACFFHRIFEYEVAQLKGHFGPINSLAFQPDGRSYASGGEDGYVRIHHFDEDYFSSSE